MRQATLEEAAKTLGELIEAVRAGETVVIMEGGRAVAQLLPPEPAPAVAKAAPEAVDWDERLARLEKAGLIRRATKPPVKLEALPGLIPLTGVLDALLEERREGR